jgi:hypothetical protein
MRDPMPQTRVPSTHPGESPRATAGSVLENVVKLLNHPNTPHSLVLA